MTLELTTFYISSLVLRFKPASKYCSIRKHTDLTQDVFFRSSASVLLMAS